LTPIRDQHGSPDTERLTNIHDEWPAVELLTVECVVIRYDTMDYINARPKADE